VTRSGIRSPDGSGIETIVVGDRMRIIVLSGVIRGEVERALRDELLAAIEVGATEILLDLSQVESMVAAAHDLVAAASLMLSDRGGVLVALSERPAGDTSAHVFADVRDSSIGELLRGPRSRLAEPAEPDARAVERSAKDTKQSRRTA
jgi:anti-anti-sigma regulatory factor